MNRSLKQFSLPTPGRRVRPLKSIALLLFFLCFFIAPSLRAVETSITYPGKSGPGSGKHVVFIAGDEEYRSEEALPMLAKILSQRHGFKCTVLFSVDPDGTINPDNTRSLSNPEALDSADALVLAIRFRNWPDETLACFEKYLHSGKPIIALRTSTHPFNGIPRSSPWAKWNYNKKGGFGKLVLGETWVSHWATHKVEATRGIIELSAKEDPILNGVTDVFGDSDIYEAYPPADAKILLRGQALKGMNPTDPPADYKKKRSIDKQEQGINEPMMPIVWTRLFKNESGTVNRILCTTMGAATDLLNDDLRRLIINAVYWGVNLPVPAKADVAYVDEFKPKLYGATIYGAEKYGARDFRRGLKVSDHELGKVLPPGDSKPVEGSR